MYTAIANYSKVLWLNSCIEQLEESEGMPTRKIFLNKTLGNCFIGHFAARLISFDKQDFYVRPHKVNFLFSVPTNHFKMTRPPAFFFFIGNQSGRKMVYKRQNALWRVRSGDKTTKMQTIVYLRSQNIEAWLGSH